LKGNNNNDFDSQPFSYLLFFSSLLISGMGSLEELYASAAGSPFEPTVSKNSQFFVGFSLLVVGKQA